MIKINKYGTYLVVALMVFLLANGTTLSAASSAKQLEKGISLYNQNKDDKAMDYFIDVLVSGNEQEVATANRYIDLIHNRLGGIQTPVEVDVNFKEGEVKRLSEDAQNEVRQAQADAQAAAELAAQTEAAKVQAAKETAAAQQQAALQAVDAQQKALTDWIEEQQLAQEEQARALQEEALKQADMANQEAAAKVAAEQAAAKGVVEENLAAIDATAAEMDAAIAEDLQNASALDAKADELIPSVSEEELATSGQPARDAMLTTSTTATDASSIFADLTSPDAIKARELYTEQKIASMTQAAIKKINDAKGVQLYMRDEKPDALEIDPEVIFDKNNFRPSAQPLLNDIYELLALTQGSAYVILPPGSYTDDVTLSGIRQAMGLNSYLIKRGISQGKVHYNMGLVNEEPPARFANLHGLAVVFDYDAKLPTILEKNENDEKAPLLSMAIVPLCHAIDRSLGEAFAIDFSVLETVNPLDNWVLQVVQHGHDGKFYIVRQLEGFAPVYHQILFNGRKGIIGPELPCGKYTLVLTGTDLKGKKQTLRRRVIVKCSEQKKACTDNSCGAAKTKTADNLDYKAARLWVKPGRTMRAEEIIEQTTTSEETVQAGNTTTTTKTVTTTTIVEQDNGSAPVSGDSALSALTPSDYPASLEALPDNNPYDMPYEDLD
ncbi:MAG: hypothetical protein J6V32_02875 [Elusimicrobiaceae bacterium]|nr:hypothetical protein [Elusimicrobiaceae bacterium]